MMYLHEELHTRTTKKESKIKDH